MTALPADVIAIGLGGNVGGEAAVRERFVRAREALAQLGDVSSAPLYRTVPIGPDQPAFLNSALRVCAPDATPGELVAIIQMVESMLGRDRANEVRWGPRTLDLDVLLWGTRRIQTPELEVPHPRMAQRRFVLAPLIALFGNDLVVGDQTLGALIRAVPEGGVDEIMTSW
ncbi:MAG: 2-amino-4-hydroxy-6-hydroxymethyldihydropteridine diphosphokinase [Kofleriaceae bacterium]